VAEMKVESWRFLKTGDVFSPFLTCPHLQLYWDLHYLSEVCGKKLLFFMDIRTCIHQGWKVNVTKPFYFKQMLFFPFIKTVSQFPHKQHNMVTIRNYLEHEISIVGIMW